MNKTKWAQPITIGSLNMCPFCVVDMVAHTVRDTLGSFPQEYGWQQALLNDLLDALESAWEYLSEDGLQHAAQVMADHAIYARRNCDHHHYGAVDKPIDAPEADEVPF